MCIYITKKTQNFLYPYALALSVLLFSVFRLFNKLVARRIAFTVIRIHDYNLQQFVMLPKPRRISKQIHVLPHTHAHSWKEIRTNVKSYAHEWAALLQHYSCICLVQYVCVLGFDCRRKQIASAMARVIDKWQKSIAYNTTTTNRC